MNTELRNQLLAMKKSLDDAVYAGQALEPLDDRFNEDMRTLHRQNAQRLSTIIDEYGWPSVALVGEEGTFAAWTIAQYASEFPALQRKFLGSLSGAVHRGEVTQPQQLAFLLDRVRFNQGQPQRYGTFLDWTAQGQLEAEIEDRANVNEWRKLLGFPSYEFACAQQMKDVTAAGGRPPQDFQAYQQKQRQWAKQLNWRVS